MSIEEKLEALEAQRNVHGNNYLITGDYLALSIFASACVICLTVWLVTT